MEVEISDYYLQYHKNILKDKAYVKILCLLEDMNLPYKGEILESLQPILERIYKKENIPKNDQFTKVSINKYDPGQGEDTCEKDNDNDLIAIVSIGSSYRLNFYKDDILTYSTLLENNSLLFLREYAIWNYDRCIPARSYDLDVPRQTFYSIVFKR